MRKRISINAKPKRKRARLITINAMMKVVATVLVTVSHLRITLKMKQL